MALIFAIATLGFGIQKQESVQVGIGGIQASGSLGLGGGIELGR